jgi:enterochelin esterase family protein
LLFLLVLLLLCPWITAAQDFVDFDDFLRRYEATPESLKPALAQAFVNWQRRRGGFPIRKSNGEAVFFYIGDSQGTDVRLTGDFRQASFSNVNWDNVGEPMDRVGSVFYKRKRFEPDARLDYKFVIDGKDRRDPLNPRTLISGSGGGEVSELVMPEHRMPSIAPIQDGRQGSLRQIEESWAQPRVTVYLPPGYDPSNRYPTIYTADGAAWVELIRLPALLDQLIAKRAIEPVIAVMIDAAADRSAWYSYNEDYLKYLRRVIDHVDKSYATRPQAIARVHAGTSAGGRAALYAGLELPGLFSNLALLSPSLSGPVYYFEPYFSGRQRPDPKSRIWMSAGTYEGYIYRDAQVLEAYFKKVEIPVRAVYLHQGHSFGAWRESTEEMLLHFFPSTRAPR